MIKKLTAFIVSMVMVLGMSVPAYAADEEIPNAYVTMNAPGPGTTYYIGQIITYSARVTNPWGGNYWCHPFVGLTTSSSVIKSVPYNYMTSAGYMDINGTFSTSSLSPGTYYVGFDLLPILPNSTNLITTVSHETAMRTIYVRKLARPTSVKLKTGKRKVTISWKKASGAVKYQVYRSTKKSSGYSRIATTSSARYVDRKAKKGKRYYYRIRSYNAGAVSSYTAAKRSSKVK